MTDLIAQLPPGDYSVTDVALGTTETYTVPVISAGTISGAIEGGTLSVEGDNPGALTRFQWQSSPDDATWTDIAGAERATYSPPSGSAGTYYRRKMISPNQGEAETPSVELPESNPASDLFTGTETGGFWRIHPDNTFTDTNGTTNASIGDPVAFVEDLSGNGNHRIQSVTAYRPLLQQDANGGYYLSYDGIDDFIDVTYPSELVTPVSSFSVVRYEPDLRVLVASENISAKRLNISISSSKTLSFYAKPRGGSNSNASGITVPPDPFTIFIGVVWEQEDSIYRIQGVQNTGFFDPGPNDSTAGFRVGSDEREPPTEYTETKEYGGLMIDRALTPLEFEQVEAYFANEVGITL